MLYIKTNYSLQKTNTERNRKREQKANSAFSELFKQYSRYFAFFTTSLLTYQKTKSLGKFLKSKICFSKLLWLSSFFNFNYFYCLINLKFVFFVNTQYCLTEFSALKIQTLF